MTINSVNLKINAPCVASGVETEDSGGSMNLPPELLGATSGVTVNNILLYVSTFAVCNKLTLLSHWLAFVEWSRPTTLLSLLHESQRMCKMTHLHSTRRVFNCRRGHLRINTKASIVELTPLPRPGSRPFPNPHPALSTSGFSFSPWGQSNWGPLSYYCNSEPSEPCYATAAWVSWEIFFQQLRIFNYNFTRLWPVVCLYLR